ncbi:MAG: 2-C-methyl-D-erythritol 4-phosphate cytidylyltransferase [Deltaproteobacteria bacterium]|nr:2-C-methyl-D-erythritol 4-phosphate cytidylyltransferase [Deltaproteobacteria bacterium]
MKTIALITAAGKGQRMQSSTPKQYLSLGGKPILAQTLQVFEDCSAIDGIYVIVPEEQMDMVQKEIVEKYHFKKVLKVVRGGRVRQYSVWNGLNAISAGCSIVVVHDGVRPLISSRLIARSVDAAQKNGAAVVGVLARDTVKRAAAGKKIQTLPREEIWLAQTPQTFQFPLLMKSYQKAHREEILGTDDAYLVERLGYPVTLIPGDYSNIKITTPEDLILAEALFPRGKQGK